MPVDDEIQSAVAALTLCKDRFAEEQEQAIGNIVAWLSHFRARCAYFEGVAAERQKFIDYLMGAEVETTTEAAPDARDV